MADSGKIDNPVDAAFEAWPADPENIGDKVRELALAFGGLFFPPLDAFKILMDQFSISSRFARVEYLFGAVRTQLQILESQIGENQERVKAIQDRIQSAAFREATAVACEEAARAINVRKIDELAAVLIGPLTPNQWADPGEDIGVMIRDIAQLGDKDLKVLATLKTVHSAALSATPNLNDADSFSRETTALKKAVAKSGVHPDDFLSTCERLRGFGLAAEVPRNSAHMAPNDFCYRPTRRGLAVLTYLEVVAEGQPRSAG